MDIFETIKNAVPVKDVIERYLAPLNKQNKVSCPMHYDKTPSLSVDTKKNMFKCFSAGCDFKGDAIRFVERHMKLEPIEAAKLIAHDFNLQIDFESEFSKTPQGRIRTYIKECQSNIGETDYFQKRGLSAATIKTFGLGYDPKERAVVIPYSSTYTYYQRRSIADKRFYKPKTEDAGPEPLWNAKALQRTDKQPIFIVESPICAMSIAQYGGTSIALCGAGVNKLADALKACRTISCLILALDNDEAGKKMTESVAAELDRLKVKHITYNIAGGEKDPNDLLLKSADKLCRNIQDAMKEAFPLTRERTDLINARQIVALKIPPKTWLIENILPLGLGMLVAGSKVGKSWMCLQIGSAIAQGTSFLDEKCNQYDVLYYALEDNDERLQYRLKVLFKTELPPDNLYFLQECKRIDEGLLDELETVLRRIPTLKCIIFDTFQMIRGQAQKNESAYSYDYRELVVLRRFAADHKIAIKLVHHTRKMLDENDTFNMATGSTGILGAVDNMYFIFKKKRMGDEPSLFSQTGRDVKQTERIVARSEEDGVWRKLGTPDEETAKAERDKYEGSVVVKTLRALFKQYPSGWNGTTRDLMNIADDLFGNPLVREEDFGREIKRVKYQLRSQDGIDHKDSHKKRGTWHEFFPKKRFDLFTYNKAERDD